MILNKKIIFTASLLIGFFCISFNNAFAFTEEAKIIDAEVLNVLDESEENIIDNIFSPIQTIEVLIKSGDKKGEIIEIENDFTQLKSGDKFYLSYTEDSDGIYYQVYGVNRTNIILILSIIFLILIFMFGGFQGLRGLVSLALSLLLIIHFLLPNIINGVSPVLISIVASSLIIILGSYVTHGFNRTTSAAVISMIITVVLTGFMAEIALDMARITGITDEEAFLLNIKSGGNIDILGLLLGGVIIGLLGVLYDIAISQAVSVEELLRFAPESKKGLVYKRAIRMGREHIGALVNTLAIAYVGASLPLFLLFFGDKTVPFMVNLNHEIFATEIIRTLVGSIGLILAVPITTFIAIKMLYGKKLPGISDDHMGHTHHH